jgi:molybdopterin-guanine dinucleotide biosynthesis protein A
MSTVTGVILAGGRASRFGGPKGLAEVGGARILDRVAAALGEVADALLLIANDPTAAGWLPGVRVAGDVVTNRGALGGVHAALHHARGAALVVAWDMPFVPAALLAELRAMGDAGAPAATPESRSPRGVEPLCAYYGAACLAAAEQRLRDVPEGRHVCPSTLLADVGAARLPLARVTSVYGDPDILFMNVNTPDDLARARAHAASLTAGRAER